MYHSFLKANKKWLASWLQKLQIISLKASAKECGLSELAKRLKSLAPDLTEQYSTFKIDNEYLDTKVRNQHAFQIQIILDALGSLRFPSNGDITIIDVGDSSGTHLSYLDSILQTDNYFPDKRIKLAGVNSDPVAVDKILSKGFDAKLCKAEDLSGKYNIRADVLISLEMIEHLSDPISFLDSISKNYVSDNFIITVPYLSKSRVGLHHIRQSRKIKVFPENTHIFELCPSDWQLIFLHSGWRVVKERIYRQYPQKSIFRFMKILWKNFDFEGFYGVVLARDRRWAQLYNSSGES
jgi:2-polyprenyl-3-methyl-5-hydroxy-6-metoxy-1,4-benzoquinol methylase